MPQFKLTLTDDHGVILRQWTLSTDADDENTDAIVPLRGFGRDNLCDEINEEVR